MSLHGNPPTSNHQLNINLSYVPLRQNKHKIGPERIRATKEQVDKLHAAKFTREILYPNLLANALLVKRSNKKWACNTPNTEMSPSVSPNNE